MTKIKEATFKDISLTHPIFRSLKEDYPEFETWYEKKQNENLYIANSKDELAAILYLKVEEESDESIMPNLPHKKRLKVGTFKVEKEKLGIGTKLLELIYKKAKEENLNEIYLTVHETKEKHLRFISFIEKHGFIHYGYKSKERVYVKTLKEVP